MKTIIYKILIPFLVLTVTVSLYAHGTKYEILPNEKVCIKAMFGSGEPMANAKFLIFPPNSTNAEYTSKTDKDGTFCFIPQKPGTHIIQIRDHSGHGQRININIDETMNFIKSSNDSSNFFNLQKIIMALCVCWGFIGTALYFKSKKGQ